MRKRKRLRRKEIRKRRIIVITALFSVTFLLASGYAAFSTNLNINAKGNLKEASRVIQSWGSEAATDFHNSQYKENIVSATFLDTNKVPTSVVESWDVSEDQKGGVKDEDNDNDPENSSEDEQEETNEDDDEDDANNSDNDDENNEDEDNDE